MEECSVFVLNPTVNFDIWANFVFLLVEGNVKQRIFIYCCDQTGIRSFEFADVKETKIFEDNGEESGVVLESTIQTIPDSLVHIPIICSAHNEILAYIELFLYSEVRKSSFAIR